jgi:hypothetical protein
VTSSSLNTTSYLLFANATGNTSVYLNTTNSPKVNPSNGRVIIGNSTAFTSQLRVIALSSGTFHPLTVGYAAAYNNFKVSSFSNNTQIALSRFLSSGASQSSSWTSYGNPYDYEEISFAGRTYINANGSGTSDSRLISFGGGANDQVKFYMIGNSTTVPTIGGYGVYIERNMYINGTFSAGNVAMVSSDPNISCTKTITANADRWVSDFTTGTNAGVNAAQQTLSSVNYDRIVYVTHYSSGTGGAQIQVEASSGYKTTGRIYDSGYSSTSAIVPAGKQFRIYLDWVAGTTIYDITIYKLGRG